ncbi:MAG: amidohydrolase [Eubacteriales bacterium]|jgi:imidazolonepropionase-like amidohydrolase|nr:amidohydrolase [Eubacteriales bacterium]
MLLLKNGLIHTMTQEVFSGDILIENGKISAIGAALFADDAEVIDLAGQFVLPGLIDAHCHIGMWEDGMGEEGADGNETTDPITPELRAVDGLNPFDPCFKEAREAGVTTVVTGPGSANVIGGQFAALKTYGRSIEEMVLRDPIAMKAATGENPKSAYAERKVAPTTRMAIASLFRSTMTGAVEYQKGMAKEDDKPDKDIAMEALLPVINRDLTVKIHAHRADDILTGLRLAKEFNLKVTIDHCTEGYMITDVLKDRLIEQGAGIIIGPLLSERSKIELKNLSFSAPRVLEEAGVPFALMTDHPAIPIQFLPVQAGLAVREGLSEETALRSITRYAAEIVGISDRVGTLEVGKDADIAVFDGHPFDYRTHCVLTLINGIVVHNSIKREA